MKNILLVFMCVSTSCYANDIEFFETYIYCKVAEKNSRKKFEYFIPANIRNASNKELRVVTRFDSISIHTNTLTGRSTFIAGNDVRTIKDVKVIPPESNFNIATLMPNEIATLSSFIAEIKGSKAIRSNRYISEATITYDTKNDYEGRYGYWSGVVVSDPVKVVSWDKSNPCKP